MQIKINTKDLERAFKDFPKFIGDSTRFELKKSSRDLVNHARKNHRYIDRTGNASRSIQWRYMGDFKSEIGFDLKRAEYLEYLHEGTRPHVINAKKKKSLRFVGGNGKFIFSKKVMHPGIKSDKFMYSAEKDITPKLIKNIGNHIKIALERSF